MPTNNLFASLKKTIQKFLPQSLPPDPNEPVTIATLQPTMEAQGEVMRSRLEAAGIPCFIIRERTYYVDPIQLRVRRADAEEARVVLKETDEK